MRVGSSRASDHAPPCGGVGGVESVGELLGGVGGVFGDLLCRVEGVGCRILGDRDRLGRGIPSRFERLGEPRLLLAIRVADAVGELADAGVDLGEQLMAARVLVHEVRDDEAAALWPTTPKEAATWQYDGVHRVWVKP